jgi:carbon-monoxide dehydrogenase large subunit
VEGRAEKYGIGQSVRRREDVRLLTGRGRYTDDLDPPGGAQAVILRFPHAHARIVSIARKSRRPH